MSDFWNTSDGESATDTGKEYEQPSGNIDPIPNDSNVLAFIAVAKWAEDKDFNKYIELEWTVEQPQEYANRKIWQKLWLKDPDPRAKTPEAAAKKRDKALRMLAAIDANCGGKLARSSGEPDNDDLAIALQAKLMTIKVMVWEMQGSDGTQMQGNWIAGVFPKSKGVKVNPDAPKPAAKPATKAGATVDDEDIPF